MAEMNAAVVTSFDEPPHYQRFPVPELGSPDELLVDEIAAGTIAVTPRTMPLADVARIWSQPDMPGERTVLVP